MIDALLLLTGAVGLLAGVGLVGAEYHQQVRRRATWQTVQLRFGRDVSAEAVLAAMSSLAGLRRGVLVALDVRSDSEGIRHYLATDRATMETLRGGLRAALPGLRLLPVEQSELRAKYRSGRSMRLRGRLGVLRFGDTEQTAAAVLAALQPLGRSEQVLLRWVLRSGRAQPLPTDRDGAERSPEDRRLLRLKNEGSVLEARCYLAAQAGHTARASHLLGRLSSVLRSRSTAYGHLKISARSAAALERDLQHRVFRRFDRCNANELVGLLGWPIDTPALPGVSIGTSPLRIPGREVPKVGRVLGTATWPGSERAVAQPVVGALSHSLISGPTGTGKSTLLTNLAVQDMAAGRGLVLIDGKGDTAEAVLHRVPPKRESDVIVLDCATAGPLPGLQLFGDGDPGLAADVVLGVFSDLFKDAWGPLSERYLRAGLVAVANDPDGTLADVPFVYSDANYRRRVMGLLRDPLTRSTLAAYESMGAAERSQQLAAPLGKLGSLLGRPSVRTVLGQAKPALDLKDVLRRQQIVVVSLAPARIGAAASRLIAAVLIFALFQAVQSRSEIAARARRPFMVAIDEPKALGDLPMPLDALLEQARGLGVGVTLAPQSLGQLPKALREAILTNAATRVAFTQNADDARLLARDLAGIAPEDLQDLAAFEAAARIGLGPGSQAPPVTLATHHLSKSQGRAEAIGAASATRYGQTLEQVDEALDARHRATPPDGATAIGRARRRTP